MSLLVLNAHDLTKCVDLDELRASMRQALIDHAHSRMPTFSRMVQRMKDGLAIGLMPAFAPSPGLIGYKTVTVSSNFKQQESGSKLNSHQGFVTLIDEKSGLAKVILDATTVTALRTAAVSAAVTERLSREDSEILGIIGTGRQAWEHVIAIRQIRSIKKVHFWGRSAEGIERFSGQLKTLGLEFKICSSPPEVATRSDILVSATPSSTAILNILDLPPGIHVNAVGACRPGMCEFKLSDQTDLKIYLDSAKACMTEADEIRLPKVRGLLTDVCLAGEVGGILTEPPIRIINEKSITFFKSVGLGIEDIYAGTYLYEKALQAGLGTNVEFP